MAMTAVRVRMSESVESRVARPGSTSWTDQGIIVMVKRTARFVHISLVLSHYVGDVSKPSLTTISLFQVERSYDHNTLP
jgi:hypothetical protein